jgi:hypothetical protein
LHLAVEVAPPVVALDHDRVGTPAFRAGGRHRSAPNVAISTSEQASGPSINPGSGPFPRSGIQSDRCSTDENSDCS